MCVRRTVRPQDSGPDEPRCVDGFSEFGFGISFSPWVADMSRVTRPLVLSLLEGFSEYERRNVGSFFWAIA